MKGLSGYAEKYAKKIDEREENHICFIPQEKFQAGGFWKKDNVLDVAGFLEVRDAEEGEGYRILVNWGTFATYETLEQVDEVLKMIQSAIERGEKNFKLPEQEYFYQLESLFNAQRILKNYMSELKKAIGYHRLILKDRIAWEQQRITEILSNLKEHEEDFANV